jgi:hypothetical protein
MEMLKTKLHVVFVGTDRRIIREVYTNCFLTRDCGIPHIHILDDMIMDMLEEYDKMPMPFYDIKSDRFNFKVSELCDITEEAEKTPDEILLEILEVESEDGDVIEYIHLEPGLWKTDDDGRYRICDDSINHLIMDTKILPMIEDNSISFDDGAAMTLFYYLSNNMSFHYFDTDNDEDIDCKYECDGDCNNCDNMHCQNPPVDECGIEDGTVFKDHIDGSVDKVTGNVDDGDDIECKLCGCPKKDECKNTIIKQPDFCVESLYPKNMTDEGIINKKKLADIMNERVKSIKNKKHNKIKFDGGITKYYGTIRHHKRRK